MASFEGEEWGGGFMGPFEGKNSSNRFLDKNPGPRLVITE